MSGCEKNLGDCACGAVRFAFQDDTLLSVNCHCRDCQRATGSADAAILITWISSFEFTQGELKIFEMVSSAGETMRRGFRADCGSLLTIMEPHRPKLVLIHAASLDNPSYIKPFMDIFTSSAQV